MPSLAMRAPNAQKSRFIFAQVKNVGLFGVLVTFRALRLPVKTDRRLMPPVPDQLPPPIRRFVNRRAELDALDRLTTAPRAGEVPVVIVSGMSGAGKTATSLHWA